MIQDGFSVSRWVCVGIGVCVLGSFVAGFGHSSWLAGRLTAPRVGVDFRQDIAGGLQPVGYAVQQAEDPAPSSEPPPFEDWPDPRAVLFVTGNQDGYIEPCGCTGLENAKGGLLRRHTVLKQIQQRNWPVVTVDAGNQIRRFGVQPTIKFGRTMQSLVRVMDYHVVALGPADLRVPDVDLLQTMTNNRPAEPDAYPYVAANVTVLLDDATRPFRVVEAGGIKFGITAVVGDEETAELRNDGVTVRPVRETLGEVVPRLQQENCDMLVLVVQASVEESHRLAEEFPVFDVLVTAGGAGEPTQFPESVQTGDHVTQVIQVGVKGMYVGALGLFDDPQQPLRYERIVLDNRFEDSEEMKVVFRAYQNQLENLGLEGLQLRPVPHPTGRSFVGSEKCGECHTTAYGIWKDGPHAPATKSLYEPGERTWVLRHHDPECLSCHVTGWNPQNFYPYDSGFLSLADRLLHGNGCENCHGPGSQHVAAEQRQIEATPLELVEYRRQMRVTLDQARRDLCIQCHDIDNSPDFHQPGAFEKYWEQIEHYGLH